MALITKMLGIAINDYDEGKLSRKQLISIFQEAIDNGDILLPDNELYVVAAVFPLLDKGILKPFQHSGAFESRMNKQSAELLARLRAENASQ